MTVIKRKARKANRTKDEGDLPYAVVEGCVGTAVPDVGLGGLYPRPPHVVAGGPGAEGRGGQALGGCAQVGRSLA